MRKDCSRKSTRTGTFALVLASLLGCTRASGDASPPRSGAQVAPAFVNLEQLEAEISRFRGRGLLLNFWATWCAPCVAELPGLVETEHAYKARGGEVLLLSYDWMVPGVTRDGVRELVEAFVSSRKLDAPVLIFDGDNYDAINARFELPGEVPVTLAFDRNGKIVDRQEGRADQARWAEMMERALAP